MSELHAALHEHFGHAAFRPGQEEVVAAALAGRDVLVVMPTGAGKSLCYQLPALMRPNEVTVVVSPLVSLMADQVAGLERAVAGRAALINSQRDAAENRDALARVRDGGVRLLYVAPERFAAPGFVDALEGVPIGMFVVDEAHCVSQWGHDFRPDYFELPRAARALGARQIFAATATATPRVAGDVIARLGLRDPVRVTTGFDRPNLSYIVIRAGNDVDRRRRITAVLSDPAARPAIVYAGTRARTEELADALRRSLGVGVAAYHAGLDRETRDRAQRAFMADEVEIVVATNAFGMGIDKPDVRTVCHAAVPESLEAYYQEAGRGGRDGAARALPAVRRRARQGPARPLHQPVRGRGGTQRALGAVPRDLGLRRGRRLPARSRSSATSATAPPRTSPRESPAATSAIRPPSPRPRARRRARVARPSAAHAPRLAPGPRPRRAPPPPPPAPSLTARSSSSSSPRAPRSGARAPSRSCAAGAPRSSWRTATTHSTSTAPSPTSQTPRRWPASIS